MLLFGCVPVQKAPFGQPDRSIHRLHEPAQIVGARSFADAGIRITKYLNVPFRIGRIAEVPGGSKHPVEGGWYGHQCAAFDKLLRDVTTTCVENKSGVA